jgi:hypothetical protein
MPKRPSRSEDEVQAAFRVVQTATGEKPGKAKPKKRKNPAAVALGRLGGKKGGKARAAALSPKERSEIARKAAEKRWGTKPAG